MPAASLAVACQKTKMCAFYPRGLCKRGEACNFAHCEEELKPLPDFRKTRICPTLISFGFCGDLKACRFAHSRRELRTFPRKRDEEIRMELHRGQELRTSPHVPDEEVLAELHRGKERRRLPRMRKQKPLAELHRGKDSTGLRPIWMRDLLVLESMGFEVADAESASSRRGSNVSLGDALPQRQSTPDSSDRASLCPGTLDAEEVNEEAEMEDAARGMVFGRMATEDPERAQSFLSVKNTFIHFDGDVQEQHRRSGSAPCRLDGLPSSEGPALGAELGRRSAAAPAPPPLPRPAPPAAARGAGAGLRDPGRPASPIRRRAAKHACAAPVVGDARRLG